MEMTADTGTPHEGVERDDTEMSVEARDALDSAEGIALAPRESFDKLITDVMGEEEFSVRNAQDVNFVMDAFDRRARHLADHFSSIEQHTLEVLIVLKHPERRMTREWDEEFKVLQERNKDGSGNPLKDEEKHLLAAFDQLNKVAPFLPDSPSAPKDFSKLGTDSDAQLQKVEADIKAAEEKSGLTRQAIELLRAWDDGDFMGTGLSTKEWMALADFDKRKFTKGFVEKERKKQVADDVAESDNLTIAQALERLALNISMIHKSVRGRTAVQEEMSRVYLGALEAVPAKSLKRELGRFGRRLKRGLDVSFAKASNAERAMALGGAVVLLGAALMSDKAWAKALRKFSLGGVVGIAGLVALDVGSGALFNGKRLSEKGAEALRLVGLGVSDNFYKVFAGKAEGGTEEAKRKHVENIDIFAGYAGDMKFSDLLERYKMVEGNSERKLELPGFTDDGFIGDTKLNHSRIAYEAMYLVYKKYGTTIDQWDALHPHGPKLDTFTFLGLVTELVIHDPAYEIPKEYGAELLNGAARVLRGGVEAGEVLADRLGEYGSRFFGDKAEIGHYLQEVFPEDDYGKGIGFEEGSADEHVLTLPGGVRVEFREEYREKVQKKSPGRKVNGFSLKNPYKGGAEGEWTRFGLDANNRDDIMDYCEELILDTAEHKMPEMVSNPVARETMRTLRSSYGSRLQWNEGEKHWAIPGFTIGAASYEVTDTEGKKHKIEFPGSRHNVFLHLEERLTKGGFAIGFYRNERPWDKKAVRETFTLDQLQERAEMENFKSWVVDQFRLPFRAEDVHFTQSKLADVIKDGKIEGQVGSSYPAYFVIEPTTVKVSVGSGDSATIQDVTTWKFRYEEENVGDAKVALKKAKKETVGNTFDELIKAGKSVDERLWPNFRDLQSLKLFWKNITDGKIGTWGDQQWEEALEGRKNDLVSRLDDNTLSDFELRSILESAQTLTAAIAEYSTEPIEAVEFEAFMLQLEMLGYPEKYRSHFMGLKYNLEALYSFESGVFPKITSLFYGKTADALEVLSNDSSTSQKKLEADGYIDYVSKTIQHQLVGLTGAEDLVTEAKLRELSRIVDALPDFEAFQTDPKVRLEYSILSMYKIWLDGSIRKTSYFSDDFWPDTWNPYVIDYPDTVAEGWMYPSNFPEPDGFDPDRHLGPVLAEDGSGFTIIPGIEITLPNVGPVGGGGINFEGLSIPFFKSPLLNNVFNQAFQPDKWAVVPRFLKATGLLPTNFFENLRVPKYIDGVKRVRREQAQITEEYISQIRAMGDAEAAALLDSANYQQWETNIATPYATAMQDAWIRYLTEDLTGDGNASVLGIAETSVATGASAFTEREGALVGELPATAQRDRLGSPSEAMRIFKESARGVAVEKLSAFSPNITVGEDPLLTYGAYDILMQNLGAGQIPGYTPSEEAVQFPILWNGEETAMYVIIEKRPDPMGLRAHICIKSNGAPGDPPAYNFSKEADGDNGNTRLEVINFANLYPGLAMFMPYKFNIWENRIGGGIYRNSQFSRKYDSFYVIAQASGYNYPLSYNDNRVIAGLIAKENTNSPNWTTHYDFTVTLNEKAELVLNNREGQVVGTFDTVEKLKDSLNNLP